tara:strand:+ start:2516 stop:3034 length:519 start_codon:yes stop_codon:yes gene_type:complete
MNIFYLHEVPEIAAKMHCDKHVVKMVLESGQMLSTCFRLRHQYTTDENGHIKFIPMGKMYENVYKMAHVNHPSTVWVTQSVQHWDWLYKLFCALCDEYTYRYGKIHMTDSKLRELFSTPPQFLEDNGFTPPPQCMFEEYKCEDTVQAYRQYYLGAKKGFLTYTKREKPEWIE